MHEGADGMTESFKTPPMEGVDHAIGMERAGRGFCQAGDAGEKLLRVLRAELRRWSFLPCFIEQDGMTTLGNPEVPGCQFDGQGAVLLRGIHFRREIAQPKQDKVPGGSGRQSQ